MIRFADRVAIGTGRALKVTYSPATAYMREGDDRDRVG